jgi:hypothetical protein
MKCEFKLIIAMHQHASGMFVYSCFTPNQLISCRIPAALGGQYKQLHQHLHLTHLHNVFLIQCSILHQHRQQAAARLLLAPTTTTTSTCTNNLRVRSTVVDYAIMMVYSSRFGSEPKLAIAAAAPRIHCPIPACCHSVRHASCCACQRHTVQRCAESGLLHVCCAACAALTCKQQDRKVVMMRGFGV